jgi:folate-binding protein YgfZ
LKSVIDKLLLQYDALTRGAGVAAIQRSQVEILGKDRARLLHGLCTNDVKGLLPGGGCEAFLTDAQGHVIGYVGILCTGESFVLDSAEGEAERIIQSLDRYVVREDVRFIDRSLEWNELLVSGLKAGELVGRLLIEPAPAVDWQHRSASIGGGTISVRRTPLAGPDGFQLSGPAEILSQVRARLIEGGAMPCEAGVAEVLRIESGTPVFGRDITDGNFPQEVDRDALAISFTKGCYLGQETVARIDSLGHVNWMLRRLRLAGAALPPARAEVARDGKVIARLTASVCFSPRFSGPLALAYVRRGDHQPGKRLPTPWGEAEVLAARDGPV